MEANKGESHSDLHHVHDRDENISDYHALFAKWLATYTGFTDICGRPLNRLDNIYRRTTEKDFLQQSKQLNHFWWGR